MNSVKKHYENYQKLNGGKIPKMFNPYNESEVKDIAPTQTCNCGNYDSSATVLIRNNDMEQLRIRKLTPLECMKLQGFSEEDYKAISKRFGDSAIYHVAGDSISVSTLMAGVFGTMTNIDYRKATQDYVETLRGDYE